MQFVRKQRQRRAIKLEGGRRSDLYPHTLQFYTTPPAENISLQEFEQFAIERLKVLKAVETVGVKHIRGTDKYTTALQEELSKLRKQGVMRGILRRAGKDLTNEEYDDRRKDHISHFILRLAYCRSEELRRWFLHQEMDLFRFRFTQESNESLERYLEITQLDYKPIPDKEKSDILKELIDSTRDITAVVVETEHFYKVPFTEALDLVRGRRVYIQNGYVYVPQSELVVIVLSHYRKLLSHALTVTSRALPHLEEDDRLLPMLSSLSKRYLGEDYSNKKPTAGQVTADMIDMLSKKSFPLCMSSLHQSLKQNHHLRHWGRQQYGLFLKAIGLSLEEAIKFWKIEFTKLMDGDKFDKQHLYNIRHNYGKEGKRTDYTPYSCIKIITTNTPGPGDYHGCPFKHTDPDLLRQKLQSLRISKDGIDKIITGVKGGHYQLACGTYFELTHGVDFGFSPNHPNQYYEESRQIELGGKVVEPDTPSTQRGTPRIVKIQPVQSTQCTQSTEGNVSTQDDFDDFPMSQEEMDIAMKGVEECSS